MTICKLNTATLTVTGYTAMLANGKRVVIIQPGQMSTGSGYTTNTLTTAPLPSTTHYRVAASCDGTNFNAFSSSQR